MEATLSSEKFAKPVNFFFQEMDNLETGKWFAQAEDDFAYGCDGVASHPRGATWNFHQAAEKAIKAILISQEKDFPRTHDLPRLLTILQLEPSASDTVAQAAFILSSFLPLTRYPGDWPEINEARAKEAKEASKIILSWARKHFQQKL